MGKGWCLQSVQPCLCTASSQGSSQIPDLLTLSPAAFGFPFWTRHEVLRSVRQGCRGETILSGQICGRSDKVGGREDRLKPWKPSEPAAAVQLGAQTGGQRSNLASDQVWDSSGHSKSTGCFHLRPCRFKCSLAHGPLAKENEFTKHISFKNKWNGATDMWNDFGSWGKKKTNQTQTFLAVEWVFSKTLKACKQYFLFFDHSKLHLH